MHAADLSCVRALVFDLDGTLIDSKQDLVLSVNAMLAERGRALLPEDVISSYIGQGAPVLVKRALDKAVPRRDASAAKREGAAPRRGEVSEEEVSLALEFFLKYYEEHRMEHTRAYPGVKEALAALGDYPMAVLTNKPERISRRILEELGLAPCFRAIYGGNSFSSKKPDPFGVHTVLRDFGVAARSTLLIGDSDIDVQTARNADTWAASVTYGFGSQDREAFPADVYLDRLTDLIPLLGNRGA
jgi:phosphoglycolate phosphatase